MEAFNSYKRDPKSKAIININQSELDRFNQMRAQSRKSMTLLSRIDNLEEEVKSLKRIVYSNVQTCKANCHFGEDK